MHPINTSEKFFSGIRQKWTFPPKVIPPILTRLKYTGFPRRILMYFSYPSKKIDVFSAENVSLYTMFCRIFQR
jgi:hypothetical protein